VLELDRARQAESLTGTRMRPPARSIVPARRSTTRQGTRDLTAALRGVPLPDEFENAGDLLRSAGLDVYAELQAGAGDAPAGVLRPIVRETVTNVLQHGTDVGPASRSNG
jgi:two-component system sensor histidine kinase DesK